VATDQKTLEILREERDRAARKKSPPDAPPPAAKAGPAPEIETDVRRLAAAERGRLGAAAAKGRGGNLRPTATPAPAAEIDVSAVVAETMRTSRGEDDDRTRGADADPVESGAKPARAHVPRRELLPDIEEINSSLRPDERIAEMALQEEGAQDRDPVVRHRSGFRTGFLIVILGFAIATCVYIFAGPLAQTFPMLADTLAGYVAWVDAKRIVLATAVENLTERLSAE
jgi:hypothetical protein